MAAWEEEIFGPETCAVQRLSDGRWGLVSVKTNELVAIYSGDERPSDAWVVKTVNEIQFKKFGSGS